MGAVESPLNTLNKIRASLEQHTPWVTAVDHYDRLLDDEFGEDVLRPPHVDDMFPVIEDMVLLGRHLGYRVARLSNGTLALLGFQLDRREGPRVLIRHESRWQTVTWFISLMEVNNVKSLWHQKPWHLKNEAGKTVLTVA